jgi:hypothetical protein
LTEPACEVPAVDLNPPLPAITADEFIAMTPEHPGWLWDGYLARGHVTIMFGDPKAGKSNLIYGLLGALETDVASFTGAVTGRARALILSEEPDDTIRQKLVLFGIRTQLVLPPRVLSGYAWDEMIEKATALAVAEGCSLLIVDTFANFAQLSDDQENSAGAVIEKLGPLKHAAAQGLAVLLNHHARKSGGTGSQALRGSSALLAAANIVVRVDPSNKMHTRTIRVTASHFQAIPESVTVRRDEGSPDYVIVSGVSTTARAEEGVFRALGELGSASDREVRDYLAALDGTGKIESPSTLERARKSLVTKGLVEHVEGTSNPKLYKRVNG